MRALLVVAFIVMPLQLVGVPAGASLLAKYYLPEPTYQLNLPPVSERKKRRGRDAQRSTYPM